MSSIEKEITISGAIRDYCVRQLEIIEREKIERLKNAEEGVVSIYERVQ